MQRAGYSDVQVQVKVGVWKERPGMGHCWNSSTITHHPKIETTFYLRTSDKLIESEKYFMKLHS